MSAAAAVLSCTFCSCTEEEAPELTYDQAMDMVAVFPELDTFMPEPDVPSQGKSAKRGSLH